MNYNKSMLPLAGTEAEEAPLRLLRYITQLYYGKEARDAQNSKDLISRYPSYC
jgi:hypothetical protein